MAQSERFLSGEDRLIARHFRPLATAPGALGLTDDAAVLSPPPGHDLVLTADAVVAGVHFLPDDLASDVARKALRVNLSDLAAKGAPPVGMLLTLAINDAVTEAWLAAFAAGLGGDIAAYGCPLLGGDTVRTPGPVTVAITAIGSVAQGKMVRRSGAQAGDVVIVTGTIGDAALGLMLRQDAARAARWELPNGERQHLLERYAVPQPRVTLAEALAAHARAAMDVSDGLAGDLAKLCAASEVSADVNVSAVPLSGAAQLALAAEPSLIETILSGGDDYEIVAAIPPEQKTAFAVAAHRAGVPVAAIGHIVAGRGAPVFRGEDGQPLSLARRSFSHF